MRMCPSIAGRGPGENLVAATVTGIVLLGSWFGCSSHLDGTDVTCDCKCSACSSPSCPACGSSFGPLFGGSCKGCQVGSCQHKPVHACVSPSASPTDVENACKSACLWSEPGELCSRARPSYLS